ncbi:substrate-binding periplasmic protein [Dongshaea marina]|uniref:substrate-binding periplasmic protein n=1 Tax=Dongshaea marina TaxID=2047966 RepID=UPI000D3EA204|nr:transporter substrate-binding domain-containing protein [Dongshaea marina]
MNLAKLVPLLMTLWAFPMCCTAATITVVADRWEPYNGEPKSSRPGYAIEIVEKIFQSAGHEISYSLLPWKRAIQLTRQGRYNAIIGSYKEDAPDFIFPEEEIGISDNAFFVRKGEPWRYQGLESLKGKTIGLIMGYNYGQELDPFLQRHTQYIQYAYGADPLEININKLLYKRFDLLLENSIVLTHKASRMGVSNDIEYAGRTEHIHKIYLAFSPRDNQSTNYAALVTRGIRELRQSGVLQQILDRYGLKDWKE